MTALAETKGRRRETGAASTMRRAAFAGRLRAGGLLFPSLFLVLAGLLLPLVLMARYSLAVFEAGEIEITGFSAINYVLFFTDPFYIWILVRTLAVAFICTAFCLLLGVPAAYMMSRVASRRLKTALILATVIPLLMGNAIRAAGWMMLLSDGGLVNSVLMGLGLTAEPVRILYTGWAVIISLVALLLPFMIITLQSIFEAIGEVYEEAALTMGARPWTTFFRITLPLAMPGVFSGGLLCFVLAVNAYASPVLLGGASFQMMAPKVYEQAIKVHNWPFAASLAFVLMGVTLVLTVLASTRLQKRYGAL